MDKWQSPFAASRQESLTLLSRHKVHAKSTVRSGRLKFRTKYTYKLIIQFSWLELQTEPQTTLILIGFFHDDTSQDRGVLFSFRVFTKLIRETSGS